MLQQLLPPSIGDFLGVDFQVWGPNVSWRSALKEEQRLKEVRQNPQLNIW
jgi:hypothetical protein